MVCVKTKGLLQYLSFWLYLLFCAELKGGLRAFALNWHFLMKISGFILLSNVVEALNLKDVDTEKIITSVCLPYASVLRLQS